MKDHQHPPSKGTHPGGKDGESNLRLVAWEVTRNCNLSCIHCRASATMGPYLNELDTDASLTLLDQIREVGKPVVILTGGEPLLRADIFQIARYGTQKGLRMVMAPKEGAFEGALRGIERAREAGVEFQINTTITQQNLDEIPRIQELAVKLGAVAHHIFLLVPTGRGKYIVDQAISSEQYEETLNWFYDQRDKVPLQLKATCAPHYYRILRERAREDGKSVTFNTHGLDAVTRGCLGGTGFCFISHTGIVQPCGFLDLKCGDVKGVIWNESEEFKTLRNYDRLKGKCGKCEYRKVCGGCRARAYEATGDYLAEEPLCLYEPARAC